MGVMLKRPDKGERIMIVLAETEEDQKQIANWASSDREHVFTVNAGSDKHLFFRDIGVHEEACRQPINILFSDGDGGNPQALVSNLAHTPFTIDGISYESVEGFWQGLYFPDDENRLRISRLWGTEAKKAGWDAPPSDIIEYDGKEIRVGTFSHWRLMMRACQAKFETNEPARKALLATGNRPLVHKTRKDSQTIPGVVMAEIWMKIRGRLRKEP